MGAGCMFKAVLYAVTTSLYLHAPCLRILLMLDQGATAWATGGVYVIYTWPLPEIRVVSV